MQRAGLWERARVWRRPCSEIERAAATRGATRGRGASFADAATRCLIEHVIEHVEWMVVLLLHAANSGLRVATLRVFRLVALVPGVIDRLCRIDPPCWLT